MSPCNSEFFEVSNTINQAMAISVWAHHGHLRKDGSPFLMHPIAVCRELIDAGICDPDIQAAALLHDTLEERSDIREECIERMRSAVGERITEWVLILSDDMQLSSEERKAMQLIKFRNAPAPVRMIKLADRNANLISPPPLWYPEKIRTYATHSLHLLNALANTHPTLEKRLIGRLRLAPWNLAVGVH